MATLSNYALRLQSSLLKELKQLAKEEGTSINQMINVAVAEKISTLRTMERFRKRAQRANLEEFWDVLEKAGKNNPPMPGDELPKGWKG